MISDLAIRSKRIVTPDGIIDGILLINGNKISEIISPDKSFSSKRTIDADNNIVMPGIIDPHVHINEPGRTEWEGFNTGTRSAAAGGITTVVDMPLNASPVTTSVENLNIKIESAEKNAHINCGFYGGVVPGNLDKLEDLLIAGVFGLKAFLTHSGIDDFPETKTENLKEVLLLLKKYKRPLLVHCELDSDHPGIKYLKNNPTSYKAYLESRPKDWENNAISKMIALCRETKSHVHIVHLSSADALEEIIKARKEGLPLTVETAPHYLFFYAEQIKDGNTILKCAPPVREKVNNDKLWLALKNGDIDFIATDHSPAPPAMKEIHSGNFEKAWGGIAGLQFSLPAIWTSGKKFEIKIEEIVKWMCENPAKFLQLSSKGKLEKNYDADIVIWNPGKEFVLTAEDIHHLHKESPYAGEKLRGEIITTIVNGEVVYDHYNFKKLNSGKLLFVKKEKK